MPTEEDTSCSNSGNRGFKKRKSVAILTNGNSGVKRSKTDNDHLFKPWSKPTSTPGPDIEEGPLPEYFQLLEKAHRALCLVCAFRSLQNVIRKSVSLIRPAVENHIQTEFTLSMLGQLAFLRPQGIVLRYEKPVVLEGETRHATDNLYTDGKLRTVPEEELSVDLVNQDLPSHKRNSGEATKGGRKGVLKANEVPQLGEVQALVFRSNTMKFLRNCRENDKNPILEIEEGGRRYVPPPPRNHELPGEIPESQCQNISAQSEHTDIDGLLKSIQSSLWYSGQIVEKSTCAFPERAAVYGNLEFRLSQQLVNALYNSNNISNFYSHQAQSLNILERGGNIMVITSTSSGKSLIFQLPVLRALEAEPKTCALFIFPTKALAQDQIRSVLETCSFIDDIEDKNFALMDGDTPSSHRSAIQQEANVIYTNPDMIHITILPQHSQWARFFRNLRFVVVDELHYYNGTLGTQFAYIMRRLRRICAFYDNQEVQFISCSATIANPINHFESIFGIDNVTLIDNDGSPHGRKLHICWQPHTGSLVGAYGNRESRALTDCVQIVQHLAVRGTKTIVFCKTRRRCEHLINAIQNSMSVDFPDEAKKIKAYRGGYTASDRRLIERNMFEGRLLIVVATTALELGIDIGSLDCVVTWGFPFTVSNIIQQSGRAGRRLRDSLSIFVADAQKQDQYFMDHARKMLQKPDFRVYLDLDNRLIWQSQLQCAAADNPIDPINDALYFGDRLLDFCNSDLHLDLDNLYHHNSSKYGLYPPRNVPIRDTDEEEFAILHLTPYGTAEVLEVLELSRAYYSVYSGGIYLHKGLKYMVKDILYAKRRAIVEQTLVDWTTSPLDSQQIYIMETDLLSKVNSVSDVAHTQVELNDIANTSHTAAKNPAAIFYGTVKITSYLHGYLKRDRHNRVLEEVELDIQPLSRNSKGVWVDVPSAIAFELKRRDIDMSFSIHAVSHLIMDLLPNFVITTAGDLSTGCRVSRNQRARKSHKVNNINPPYATESTQTHKGLASSRKQFDAVQDSDGNDDLKHLASDMKLLLYDAKGGSNGSGISVQLFYAMSDILFQTYDRITSCQCLEGCEACILSDSCAFQDSIGLGKGMENGDAGRKVKIGATLLIEYFLGIPIQKNFKEL